jgi:hypothetical protein
MQGDLFMKFTAKALSALTAAGLLVGTLSVPAFAAEKKEKTLIDYIDADLKAIDKELIKIFTIPKK